jgi:hypothetical protein
MNSWIALGVNLLPAPVGPLLNSLWWITYLAIGLISWAVLSQGSSPGQILISGILIAFVLGLVGWLVNGIFAPFLEPFLGPGLTCTLATMKAQQQGGAIPPECQEQSGTPIADKTGSVNLLTASLGQSGAPFPQPRKDSTYQFPITIANPSEFDIGPVVVENGYMCGKVGGYTKCGSYDGTIFVADYRMKGNSCVKPEDNCIVGVGGPPLVVSMVGDENNPKGDIVPFDSSYVNLYVNVRYPFITSGTNDFYIAQTYRDVPKNIQACEGSGVRPLGKACTGSGPINVIPYFSPTHISLDQWNGALQPVTLTVAVSNVGNGVARVKSIEIVRFSSNINDGLNVLPDAGWVCRLSGSDSITFNEENKVAKFAEFLQNNLKAEGDTISQPAMQLEISSKESANFICNYALAGNVREILTGPYMTIKSEAKVNYDYYETPSKTDVLVQSKLA